MSRLIEFARLYAAYRKYHTARYAVRVAYEIAIKGASF